MRVFIGEIEYIDHQEGSIPEHNPFYRVMHKDLSFNYEQELRAVALVPPMINKDQGRMEIMPTGVLFPVDLKTLIKSVVLPPMSQEWIGRLVVSLLEQYGLDVPIKNSKLKINMG